MPTYVSLIHWTEHGIKNYKDSTRRLKKFTKLAESMGGSVHEALYTVGEYDIVGSLPSSPTTKPRRRPCSG